MSPSHRTARAVRLLGVCTAAAALSIGVANTAFACNIRDFSAVATCDDSGSGVIRVTDTDASGTPATVSLYIKMTVPGEEDRLLDTKTIEHPDAQGVAVDFAENWAPDTTYRIRVKAGNQVDEDIKPLLTTPSQACSATKTSPSPSQTPSTQPPKGTPAQSTPSQSTTPAAGPSTSSSPSPQGGGSNLAETGADSHTPLILGIAAALVAVGAGVVFALRRPRTSRSR
ncbi:LAETG motif-containing sortase-dependent surface protein [Streptomyces sp. NPDC046862]|uniref:LAETG motif-containing sortase-dependent surface protein n=1 Tax=Streptomyces sp. NPDC046862 TaxID=3154603 RepID=UPI0034543750